jgi:hypothetical protein
VVPPELQQFCKDHEIQLLTHSDPQGKTWLLLESLELGQGRSLVLIKQLHKLTFMAKSSLYDQSQIDDQPTLVPVGALRNMWKLPHGNK